MNWGMSLTLLGLKMISLLRRHELRSFNEAVPVVGVETIGREMKASLTKSLWQVDKFSRGKSCLDFSHLV